jgi:hypothetical protein
MNRDRRTVIYVSLIFLSGLLVGGTLMNLAEHFVFHRHHAEEYDIRKVDKVVGDMDKRLHLTPEQQVAVKAILGNAVHDYDELQEQVAPEFEQVREQGRQRIRAILNPDQRAEFDRIVAKVDATYPPMARPATIPVPSSVDSREVRHISEPGH